MLNVCPVDFFFILDSRWPFFFGKETVFLAFFVVFDCSAVALSVSFFPFGVLYGRC